MNRHEYQRDSMNTHTYIPQRDSMNITLQRVAHAVISILHA